MDSSDTPVARRVEFSYPVGLDPVWTTTPEVAIGANALSLLMPHVEPWVVTSVKRGAEGLDDEIGARARGYVAQEASHHAQHRRFNDLVIGHYRGLATVERLMAATFGLARRRSGVGGGVAFAAGFETVAFAGARWTDSRMHRLFRGADPGATALLCWHLAEEVEHKSVAWDVHRARGGGSFSYLLGALVSLALLIAFSVLSCVIMLAGERRLLHPMAWARLIGWGFSLLWEILPLIAVSCSRGHHPSHFADPTWLPVWLSGYDPASGALPPPLGIDSGPADTHT